MSTNQAGRPRQRAGQPGRASQPGSGQPGSGQPGRAGQRRARPLPKGDTLFTPRASPTRASMEQRSVTPLLWLHQLPRWLLPVLAAALLVTGLAARGLAGAAALCGLAVALAWLAAVSWPRLSAQARLLRVLVIGLVAAGAVLRALH